MKKVEIHYIEFETNDLAMQNDNYPCSGLFMTKIKTGQSDLRFVDKGMEINNCIAPELICNHVLDIKTEEVIPVLEEVKNKYDGDFILEFSRILLNRK